MFDLGEPTGISVIICRLGPWGGHFRRSVLGVFWCLNLRGTPIVIITYMRAASVT